MAENGHPVEPLRILIADDESIRVLSLRVQLQNLGYQVVGEASNGREAVELARRLMPDLIIMDIKMPVMDGIEAAEIITRERPVPIILLTAYSEAELARRAAETNISAYLMKPVSEDDLLPAITLAMTRFRQFQALRQEVESLREALEARKLVERAKGILMRRLNLTEEEAFRRMQRRSQDLNKKLSEVAEAIILADKML
ncbi:MAG TPA: response regulator [Caldilineae bacterium]|nr:response regulator [Caldilineae bacterium]